VKVNKKHIHKFVGFDLDGTILDLTGLKMRLALERGFKLEPAHTPSGVIKKYMPEEVVREMATHVYHNMQYAAEPTLMPDAKEVLQKLSKSGLPYVLISRRKTPPVAVETLKHHGLWPDVFNESNAHFVVEIIEKNVKAAELGVTHYLDDEPEVLDALVDVPNKLLFDHRKVLDPAITHPRVSSWREVEKIIFS
jgi:hypothetical protein